MSSDSSPLADTSQYGEISSSGSTVVIAYIHPGQGIVGEPFAQTLALNAANLGDKRLLGIQSTSSPDPMLSRNTSIENMLKLDPLPDWFLWWDTDMSLGVNAASMLIQLAEEHDAKVATCFGLMKRTDHRKGQPWTPVPNAYWRFEESKKDTYVMDTMPDDMKPFWCDATGFGFTIIRPQVFLDFPKKHLPWHVRTAENWGQDIRFFYYALQPGEVLYCPSIRSVHWKELGLDWDLWKHANGLLLDEAGELVEPPA